MTVHAFMIGERSPTPSAAAIERAKIDDPGRLRPPVASIPVTTCPYCLRTFDGLGSTPEEAMEPGVGLICRRCGSLVQVTPDGLIGLSDLDWRAIP